MIKRICKIIGISTTLIVLAACGQAVHAPALDASVTVQEDLAVVTRGDIKHLYVLPGLTRAVTEPVILEGGGFLANVYVSTGDRVTAGQVIASLDGGFLQNRIDDLREIIADANRLFNLHFRELSIRIQILEEANDPANNEQIQVLRLERDHLQARHNQNIAGLQAEINDMQAGITDGRVLAHIDGQIASVVSAGGWFAAVGLGVTVAQISHIDHIIVEYIGGNAEFFTENDAVKFFGVTLDGIEVELLGLRSLSLSEIEHFRSRGMDTPIQFEIASDLSAGHTVFIHFYTVFAENVLRVPSNAIFDIEDVFYVYKIEDDGRQVLTAVEVGVFSETYAEILGGLDEGDTVFVRPQGL